MIRRVRTVANTYATKKAKSIFELISLPQQRPASISNQATLSRRFQSFALMVALGSLAITGCNTHKTKPAIDHGDLKMYDCLLEANDHIHFHAAPQRGRVTVVSDYTPGKRRTHALDLKDGKESEAKILPSTANTKYAFEIFLFNDNFGQQPEEKAIFFVEHDGRVRLEGSKPDGSRRLIDSGTCKPG